MTIHSKYDVSSKDRFLTYENADYGIKIDYPSNWTEQKNSSESIIEFASPNGLNLLSVSVNNLPNNTSLENYTNDLLDTLYRSADLAIVDSNKTFLAKSPAYKIVYVYKDNETKNDIKIIEVLTIKNDRLYNITYIAINDLFSYYLPIVEKMIESFRITSNNISSPTTISNRFLTYENADYGIKIDYPSNWTKTTPVPSEASVIVKLVSPQAQSSLNIIVGEESNEKLTLLDYLVSISEFYKSTIPNFELHDIAEDTISGKLWAKLVYTSSIGEKYKTLQVFTIDDHKHYIITYVSYPDTFSQNLPIVEKMIESFRITSNNISSPTTISNRFLTYENADYGIKIDYPSNWTEIVDPEVNQIYSAAGINNTLTLSSPLGIGIVNVFTQDFLYENMSLNVFALQNIRELRGSLPNFQLLYYNFTSLAGYSAIKMISNYRIGQFDYKGMDIVSLIGNKVYYIGYSAPINHYIDYLPIVEKMIESFRITSNNISSPTTISNRFLTYENADYGIKIDYPSNWQKTNSKEFFPLPGGIIAFKSPFNDTTVFISVMNVYDSTLGVNDLVPPIIEGLMNQVPDFHLENLSSTIIKGDIAARLIYTIKIGQMDLKEMQILTKKIDKLYIILYASLKDSTWYSKPIDLFSYYLPIVEKMIDTFEVVRTR